MAETSTIERGILFSAPMVRAILDGTKTQTRRVCKNEVYSNGHHWDGHDFLCHNDYLPPSAMLMDVKRGKYCYTTSNIEGWEAECPYGQPDDRLWVKETFAAFGRWETRYSEKKRRDEWHFVDMTIECGHAYRFDLDDISGQRIAGAAPTWHVRPSIFMPRVASRILLENIGVRVERLRDISEEDAMAEGVEHPDTEREEHDWSICPQCGGTRLYNAIGPNLGVMPDTDCYQCDTHVKRFRHLWESLNGEGSLDMNPYVWCISFKRTETAK